MATKTYAELIADAHPGEPMAAGAAVPVLVAHASRGKGRGKSKPRSRARRAKRDACGRFLPKVCKLPRKRKAAKRKPARATTKTTRRPARTARKPASRKPAARKSTRSTAARRTTKSKHVRVSYRVVPPSQLPTRRVPALPPASKKSSSTSTAIVRWEPPKEPRTMKHRSRNAKGQFKKGGGRRKGAHKARKNPTHGRRRSYRRRHSAREKLPGGRIRVRRHRVTMRRRNIPTRSYTRHVSRKQYNRGPYTYKPSAAELAALNPMPMALENPLSMGEMVVMATMGAVGYGLGSIIDRFLATNPVTVNASNQLVETPAAGAVYNQDAVQAPMGLMRWLVGLGAPLALGIGGGYIGGPWTKVVLQGAAVGWGIRTIGKGLDDLMAYLLGGSTATPGSGTYGARLYASEIHAINAAKAMKGSTTPLPALTQGTYSLNAPGIQTLQGIPQIMQQQGLGARPPLRQPLPVRQPPRAGVGRCGIAGHNDGCNCDQAGVGKKKGDPGSAHPALAAPPAAHPIVRPQTLGAQPEPVPAQPVNRFAWGSERAA